VAEQLGVTRRQRWLRLALLGAALTVLVAVTVVVSSNGSGGTGVTKPESFDLPALSGGGRVRLVDFRGRPTVVNFFASWCTACDQELPGFSRLSSALKGRVNFVGVDSLETGDRNLMPRRHHITWWPLAKDVSGAQGSGLHDALGGGSAMPLTAFYDAEGRLLDVDRAALPEDVLRSRLRTLYGLSV
jgi:cytochrome c biogenesis protein CcmG/thiol:disulfide interchange protein DsbE